MSAKTGIDGDYLDLKSPHVQACINDYVSEGFPKKWLRDANGPIQVVPPATPKGKFDPWEIPWFTSIGGKYLKPVEVGSDFDIQEPPCI